MTLGSVVLAIAHATGWESPGNAKCALALNYWATEGQQIHITGIIILLTQTNPSKLPYICIKFDTPQIGNLMTLVQSFVNIKDQQIPEGYLTTRWVSLFLVRFLMDQNQAANNKQQNAD